MYNSSFASPRTTPVPPRTTDDELSHFKNERIRQRLYEIKHHHSNLENMQSTDTHLSLSPTPQRSTPITNNQPLASNFSQQQQQPLQIQQPFESHSFISSSNIASNIEDDNKSHHTLELANKNNEYSNATDLDHSTFTTVTMEQPTVTKVQQLIKKQVISQPIVQEQVIREQIVVHEQPIEKHIVHPVQEYRHVEEEVILEEEQEEKEAKQREIEKLLEEMRQQDRSRQIQVEVLEQVEYKHEETLGEWNESGKNVSVVRSQTPPALKRIVLHVPRVTEVHYQPVKLLLEQRIVRMKHEKPIIRIVRQEENAVPEQSFVVGVDGHLKLLTSSDDNSDRIITEEKAMSDTKESNDKELFNCSFPQLEMNGNRSDLQ